MRFGIVARIDNELIFQRNGYGGVALDAAHEQANLIIDGSVRGVFGENGGGGLQALPLVRLLPKVGYAPDSAVMSLGSRPSAAMFAPANVTKFAGHP